VAVCPQPVEGHAKSGEGQTDQVSGKLCQP
jgi:hypothetical protein